MSQRPINLLYLCNITVFMYLFMATVFMYHKKHYVNRTHKFTSFVSDLPVPH